MVTYVGCIGAMWCLQARDRRTYAATPPGKVNTIVLATTVLDYP